jgi:hypothetical protein
VIDSEPFHLAEEIPTPGPETDTHALVLDDEDTAMRVSHESDGHDEFDEEISSGTVALDQSITSPDTTPSPQFSAVCYSNR